MTREDIAALQAGGDAGEAVRAFSAALARRPDDMLLRLRMVRCLRQMNADDSALRFIEDGLARPYPTTEILLEWAKLLLVQRRWEEAEAALVRAAQAEPGNPQLPRLRGNLATARGDHAAAAEAYAAAVAAEPHKMEMCRKLAHSLRRAGRPEAALAALEAGCLAHPDAPLLVIEQVGLLLALGRVEAAETALVCLAGIDPTHVALPHLRGDLATARGDLRGAAAFFTAALDSRPKDMAIRQKLANCYSRLGEMDAALAVLRAVEPEETGLRAETIACLRSLGRFDEADDIVAAWQALTPKDRVQQLACEAYGAVLRGDLAKSILCWETILEIEPDHRTALAQLASAQAFSFQPDRALSTIAGPRRGSAGAGRKPARRRSGHIGQFLNELRLNSSGTAQLAAALREDPEHLISVAAALVAANPDATGPALGLVTGLARAGRLIAEPPTPLMSGSSTQRAIPRIIHQFWNDEAPPSDVLYLMDRLRTLHPDHVYRRWSDSTARSFLLAHAQPEVLRAYRAARHPAIAADIFRLAVLVAEGGIYVDADDYCRRPLKPLLPATSGVVLYQESIGWMANNFLAATPGSPILRKALYCAAAAVSAGASESALLATGPGLITRALAGIVAEDPDLRLPPEVCVHAYGSLLPFLCPGRRVSYKRTARNWALAI